MERREPTVVVSRTGQPKDREEPVPQTKPFEISKQEVWQAYLKIKANRGAAGVDRQTIEAFEQDLKGSLWVVDVDIKGFFDNIDHGLLMKAMRKHSHCRYSQLTPAFWAPGSRENYF